ncbi:hypothetical protein GQX73_g8572 [Xylaria multiplex]|uniref:Rhodopsin domain-containing protein n=1 Tax=Xylaria multiplex TaxID=323545 RepID=A0A7C8IRV4_9PEZI|nr:hypothetical protein GQX73_g8572 [Xylaria multiplex]
MKILPIEAVASWPKPNYINPESRAPIGKAIGSTLLALVTVILAIRLYSRTRLTRGFGLDDTFICLAYFPAAAFTIAGIITQEHFQWARHIWDVEPKFLSPTLLITLIHLILFDLATTLTKLSMLAMVRRLTATSRNSLENVAVLALVALITANCFIFIIVEIFQCWPISSAWVFGEASSHCINEESHLMAANIINTVTDFIVVLFSIRTAMGIQLSPRQRVVVCSLFGIGLVASSVGIMRTYFAHLLYSAGRDTTRRAWYLWLSSLVELHLGIICASIPAAKPVFIGFTKKRKISLPLTPLFPETLQPEQETGRYKFPPPTIDYSIGRSSGSFKDVNAVHVPPQSHHANTP